MTKPDHTLIIGDVHGCFEELQLILKKSKWRPEKHRLIFVGDLINKGPDSLKVLEWSRQNKTEQVLGNHELKFIEAVENNLPLPDELAVLKKQMGDSLPDWMKYIKSRPSYLEEKDFLVVHAGLVPGVHPKNSSLKDLANIRCWDEKKNRRTSSSALGAKPWHDYYKGEKLIVYGHWARQGFLKKQNSICLDSGCVYGNQLTGLFLPSRRLVQVQALKRYA